MGIGFAGSETDFAVRGRFTIQGDTWKESFAEKGIGFIRMVRKDEDKKIVSKDDKRMVLKDKDRG